MLMRVRACDKEGCGAQTSINNDSGHVSLECVLVSYLSPDSAVCPLMMGVTLVLSCSCPLMAMLLCELDTWTTPPSAEVLVELGAGIATEFLLLLLRGV